MDTENLQILVDHLRKQLQGLELTLPASRIVREKSFNERSQHVNMPGRGNMFCVHERSYFYPCKQCRRTKQDGDAKREAFFKKLGLV